MRFEVTLNAAGDIRLRTLRDRKRKPLVTPQGAQSLVCSSEVQEMTTTAKTRRLAGYGTISKGTTFGSAARRSIREGGAIIGRLDRRACVFLTGTLPGSSAQALETLAAWSGWAVAAVLNWVRDFAPESLSLGVWEWQVRGALHLHVCVGCNTVQQAQELKRRWKARWLKVLDSVCEKSGVDVYERHEGDTWRDRKWAVRTDAQTVEKDVSRYLSKYLSKGSAASRRSAMHPPSRWWFLSKRLRETIVQERRSVLVEELSPTAALNLYETVGAVLADTVPKTFPYVSPVDRMVKGLIGLLNPVGASLLYNHITDNLRLLGIQMENRFASAKLTPYMVAMFFGAHRIEVPG